MPSRPAKKPRAPRALLALGLALPPLAIATQQIAFRYPEQTEILYGQRIYPFVVFVMGWLNSWLPFSLAEAGTALALLGTVIWLFARRRRSDRRRPRKLLRSLAHAALTVWALGGAVGLSFLLLWGLNYARPTLQERLRLATEGIGPREILEAGQRSAEAANAIYSTLGVASDRPTRMPLDFVVLNEVIDRRLRDLALPGDDIRYRTSPTKKLFLSKALAYLGLSGVFIPFTGEPSMNGLLPDVSIPLVVAHEKAHQRGITHEGEASLVAFLACSGAEGYPYLRYSAFLFAAIRLIGAASSDLPEEARGTWELLGPGPTRDVTAIREFWARYEGPMTEIAEKVNDTYLRSQRVEEGIRSYGEVAPLLVALHREGKLVR